MRSPGIFQNTVSVFWSISKFIYNNALKFTVLFLASTSALAQKKDFENTTFLNLDNVYFPSNSYSNIHTSIRQKCSGFSIISGDIDTARYILLGELHTEKPTTNNCLEDIMEDRGPHTVLVGSAPLGMPAPCSEHGIDDKPERLCEGWNNTTQLQNSVKYFQKAIFALTMDGLYDKYHKEKRPTHFIDDYLQSLLKNIMKKYNQFKTNVNPADYEKDESLKNYGISERTYLHSKFEKRIISRVLKLRIKGKSYPEIFSIISSEVKQANDAGMAYLENIHQQVFYANKAMVEALRRQSMFAVVVAGKAQIVKEKEEDREAIEYLYKELKKGEDQNPYAILTMNE